MIPNKAKNHPVPFQSPAIVIRTDQQATMTGYKCFILAFIAGTLMMQLTPALARKTKSEESSDSSSIK